MKLTRLHSDRVKILEGAERYIASEKSDPFVRDRVMSHIRDGHCNPTFDKGGNKVYHHYDAVEGRETRSYEKDGTVVEYEVPVYGSVKRL